MGAPFRRHTQRAPGHARLCHRRAGALQPQPGDAPPAQGHEKDADAPPGGAEESRTAVRGKTGDTGFVSGRNTAHDTNRAENYTHQGAQPSARCSGAEVWDEVVINFHQRYGYSIAMMKGRRNDEESFLYVFVRCSFFFRFRCGK